MKILVTGASGFIGGNLVEMLAADEQNDILATGRSLTNKFDPYPNVTYFQQDLSVAVPDQNCDVCIHCAGLADDRSSIEQFITHNVKATENLLHAVRHCKVLIFISSASVYDFADGKVKFEEDAHMSTTFLYMGRASCWQKRQLLHPGSGPFTF
jgi:nucleoside-diphosphate-sugar epimerase